MIEGMAVLHMSESELARDIHAVLEKVRQGAEVVIEQNNRPVAVIRPAPTAGRASSDVIAKRKPVDVKMDTAREFENMEIASRPGALESSSFFAPKTIGQLIAEQHVHPIADLSVLAGALPDEDVDVMVAETYRDR
jgi:antitoxin (DNA-binding transcriptional repressor) of toxin-antitoxin stability system